MENNSQKPCLVETKQGFSIYYKERYLYSKYNPAERIVQTVKNIKILPGTLVLCFSPVMPYGLVELQSILPENCQLIICDFDDQLRFFEENTLKEIDIPILTKEEIYNLPVLITQKKTVLACGKELLPPEVIRRAIRIDFSAGTQFYESLYDQLYNACTSSIMTFWSNRLTLTKFGRLYSHNFFKNLQNIGKTVPIQNYYKSISKPIIVFGAGESIDKGIPEIIDKRNSFYIICVDTCLQSLLLYGIIPDAVFIEEAQSVILKAFLGTQKNTQNYTSFHIFAGLSSISSLFHNFNPNQISYFNTQFSDVDFLKNSELSKILPPFNLPMGSVGLTAVYHALLFRINDSVPVFIYGLDFSYSKGLTHGKGTTAHKQRLLSANRISSLNNYDACFSNTAIVFQGKNKKIYYTTQNLRSYGLSFSQLFSGIKNLYDSSDSGFNLNIPLKKPEKNYTQNDDILSSELFTSYSSTQKQQIQNYLDTERNSLLYLKSLLIGKVQLPQNEIIEEIKKTAAPREYLYLHFPDGCSFKYNQSFLNRIRTEIDFMLKILK